MEERSDKIYFKDGVKASKVEVQEGGRVQTLLGESAHGPRRLILFDGQCRLCLGFVSIVVGRDSSDLFRFAPLQSALGQEVLASFSLPKDLDSVVLLRENQIFTHSDAALEVPS
ncbi:unnamed protein product [Effrenium voratum]|nr:unnamed protein product [Effrenium voratum]